MRLSEHPLGITWLQQFDARDIHSARLLLDTLKLVSFVDFENSIARTVERICKETTGYIGVFALDERIIDLANKPGSSGRLAHTLTNLSRLNRDRILVQPDQNEMRLNKVKHIVLVEDFVGSGQRVKEFWNAWATKTLKSWLSYNVCELWIAGYAIHEFGLRSICDRITYLKPECIRFETRLNKDEEYWPLPVLDLCERNAIRTELPIYPRGIGHIAAPIVFQHGCPDNCPVILWKNGKTFRALFPERGIAATLYPCFDESSDSGRGPELLWNAGQYRLALSLISEINGKKRSKEYLLLLTVLGLLLRGVAPPNLSKVMTAEVSKIEQLLTKARELGLIDENDSVTVFGRDVVNRSRKSFLAMPKVRTASSNRGFDYIPKQFKKQFCGVQTTSSNALPTVD